MPPSSYDGAGSGDTPVPPPLVGLSHNKITYAHNNVHSGAIKSNGANFNHLASQSLLSHHTLVALTHTLTLASPPQQQMSHQCTDILVRQPQDTPISADPLSYGPGPQTTHLLPQASTYLTHQSVTQKSPFPVITYPEGLSARDLTFSAPVRPNLGSGITGEAALALVLKQPQYASAHGKNISIASHFDMFLLHDKPCQPVARASNRPPQNCQRHGYSNSNSKPDISQAENDSNSACSKSHVLVLQSLVPSQALDGSQALAQAAFAALAAYMARPCYLAQYLAPQYQPSKSLVPHHNLQNVQQHLQSPNLPNLLFRGLSNQAIQQGISQSCKNTTHEIPQELLRDLLGLPYLSQQAVLLTTTMASETAFAPHKQVLSHSVTHPMAIRPESNTISSSMSSETLSDKRTIFDDLQLDKSAKAVFRRLLKEVLDVSAYNFYGFLVRVLQECKAHVPLDEFYRVLFTENGQLVLQAKAPSETDKIDQRAPEDATVDYMFVLHKILEIFKEPKKSINEIPGGNFARTKLGGVNYHELLRSFLALKIIRDALIVSDGRAKDCSTTPRLTVYKVYYILCQKLFLLYLQVFQAPAEQRLILGPSKLGKLIKVVYPELKAKRLGPRGRSKYHYMGLNISTDLVSEEISALCAHDMAELTQMFRTYRRDLKGSTSASVPLVIPPKPAQGSSNTTALSLGGRLFLFRGLTGTFLETQAAFSPPSSFIRATCMFPVSQLLPVFCFNNPHSSRDSQSWFYKIRHESSDSLRKLGLDMSSFSEEFEQGTALARSQEWLMDHILVLIDTLARQPHFSRNHYLLLFLYVLVWVFPVMLCLDISKSEVFVFHLRANIHNLVLCFEEKRVGTASCVSAAHLKAFVGILNKILNLDDVANSLFKVKRAPAVIDDMFEDIAGLVRALPDDASTSVLERLFSSALVDCLNAYRFVPMMERGAASEAQVIALVNSVAERMKHSIVHGLQDLVKKVDSVQEIYEECGDSRKTRFEYLRLCLLFCHESCFDELLVERFTVPIVNSYLSLTSNQIMKYIFRTQNKRALSVLNATFRHWWVVLSFLQEYCGVVLETVGIHHSLKDE